MGHTNSTANLSLPQFIGTDKPTWLGDVNGAFSAIDSYAGTNDAAVAAAVSDASSAIAQAASAVSTANAANTTAGNASTAATNAVGTANNAVAIAGTVDSKVGLLADLTTTDRTSIVNAINEVNGKDAGDIAYDNSGSGLTATNVQDAIDEVAQGGGGGGHTLLGTVTADGVKTATQLVDELFAHASDITKDSIIEYTRSSGTEVLRLVRYYSGTYYEFCNIFLSSADNSFDIQILSSGSKFRKNANGTITDESPSILSSGDTIKLYS